MHNPFPSVTETELAILRILWERGPATIREISNVVYPHGGASHYATVQKLLERLEEKDCVTRDRASRAHRFQTLVSREQFLGDKLRDLAEKVCGGSFVPLLSCLVGTTYLTSKQREALNKLVEEIEEGTVGKPGRR